MNSDRLRRTVGLALIAVVLAWTAVSDLWAMQPAECYSTDPIDWPAPSRPYVMIGVDTSGSMGGCHGPGPCTDTDPLNSCGMRATRLNNLRCALGQFFATYDGQVKLGLATFPRIIQNCPEPCDPDDGASACATGCFPQETGGCGCGPMPGLPETRAGAFIRVPVVQDNFWDPPLEPSNLSDLLEWVDFDCFGNAELFAAGPTPLNGMLRDFRLYFEDGWSAPDGSVSFPSPLDVNDLSGSGVNGGTACRSVNVILITDGREFCDHHNDAVAAAGELYANGVTIGGKTYKIRTWVVDIDYSGISDEIASAGGTGQSYAPLSEPDLLADLAQIVQQIQEIESCDNLDNDCNGCIDEGFQHYCNTGQACCSWIDMVDRQACLDTHAVSGDPLDLPCIDTAGQFEPVEWLCVDPGETCDGTDNNCAGGIDEGDADADGVLACFGDCDDDNANVHPGAPELADGIDNQCPGDVGYGVVDEIEELRFLDSSTLEWAGGVGFSQFEMARSGDPLMLGGCTFFDTTSPGLVDNADPAGGEAFFYLARGVAPLAGSWGIGTNGGEREPCFAASCTGPSDCSGGYCEDDTCCDQGCAAPCRACNVAGFEGTCTDFTDGSDPLGECAGWDCAGYFFGFVGNTCYAAANVSDAEATCNGVGDCHTQAEECTGQGAPYLTCDPVCEGPKALTCSGTQPGTCEEVTPDPPDQTCGVGACEVTSPVCSNGQQVPCVPGTPSAETCNGIDDDCNGVVDNGMEDPYEPNDSCAQAKDLGALGSDQSSGPISVANLFPSGDEDYFVFRLRETDAQCACCDPLCLTEDYIAWIDVTLPPGAGEYEVCLTDDCGNIVWCKTTVNGSAVFGLELDGSCQQADQYDVYVRVRSFSAPGFLCEPYTFEVTFDALVCN